MYSRGRFGTKFDDEFLLRFPEFLLVSLAVLTSSALLLKELSMLHIGSSRF